MESKCKCEKGIFEGTFSTEYCELHHISPVANKYMKLIKQSECKDCKDLPEGEVITGHDHRWWLK